MEDLYDRSPWFDYDEREERREKARQWEAYEAGEGPHPYAQLETDPLLFDKKEFLVDQAAYEIFREGPVGVGPNGKFWSYSQGVWSPDDEVVGRRLVNLLKRKYNRTRLLDVRSYLAHAEGIPRITAQPTEFLINFRNGMVDWRTWELTPHDQKLRSTVQLNVPWEPTAKCPVFDDLMARIVVPEDVERLWAMIGYLLLQGNPLQWVFMLKGETGGNGKSTLLDVVQDIIGGRNISNVGLAQLTGNRFMSAELYGKAANIAADIAAQYIPDLSTLKGLTGGDWMQVERKGEHPFRFKNWAVPVFSMNEVPPMGEVGEPIRRRFRFIELPNKFKPGTHPTLTDDLRKELPGIAAKAVMTIKDTMERNELPESESCRTMTAKIWGTLDHVQRFIEAELILEPAARVSTATTYERFKTWMEREGLKGVPSRQTFRTKMGTHGFTVGPIKGVEHFKGCRFPTLTEDRGSTSGG